MKTRKFIMNEKEIAEIRRRFKAEKSNISRIRGCYINENREIISEFNESLGLMSTEEAEELLSVLKKTLSGTVGKNLIDIEFSAQQVLDSEQHKLLSTLRSTELADDAAIKTLYETIIGSVKIEGSYLILLAGDKYDVPSFSKDGEKRKMQMSFPISCAVSALSSRQRPRSAITHMRTNSATSARILW